MAADLTGDYAVPGACHISSDSDILLLDTDELEATLLEYRDEANQIASDPAVIANNSPAFDWAIASLVQCNVALGYLKGGQVDEASSQKCDCFHARMLGTL